MSTGDSFSGLPRYSSGRRHIEKHEGLVEDSPVELAEFLLLTHGSTLLLHRDEELDLDQVAVLDGAHHRCLSEERSPRSTRHQEEDQEGYGRHLEGFSFLYKNEGFGRSLQSAGEV